MDKNAIKKFATEARRELMARVSQRALLYGISPKAEADPEDDVVEGRLLSSTEKRQRAALIEAIKEKSYDQVMEEVAYTWFNRFCALRFMEVNGYLPGRVRVFTDENNAFKPQILAEAIHLEMEGLDREKVFAYKETDGNDDLYKYLLITQCNALSDVLPKMFQKIADATELLFPDNLLREGSVLHQMIETIPEEDWKDAVQIIGWLYQYYNSEKKDEVFAALKKNVKISKDNIPAATQLFTPDWIVRYMVENSLGRLWVEGHPDEALKSNWKYYLEEAEQEPEVQAQLATIREEYKALKPEDIRCIDPCSGSGHILAYMFDVLVQIYESYGYTTREAVASIVENNIYGLDIDDRAAQLSYFTVMMKACQYDKRFLHRKVQPHVYAIVESNHVDRFAVEYFCNGDAKLKKAMDTIIKEQHDAKEYGSIITVSQQDWDALYARFDEIQNESVMSISTDEALGLRSIVNVAKVMAQKYHVVITNPPYMGSGSMSKRIANFVAEYFPSGKADLFAVFMEKCTAYAKPLGLIGMMTSYTWMFLSGYQALREEIFYMHSLISLIQPEYHSYFDEAYVPICTFVFRNNHTEQTGEYIRLERFTGAAVQPIKALEAIQNINCEYRFHFNTRHLHAIPGSPLVYWANPNLFVQYETCPLIQDICSPKPGLSTGENERFLRFWQEVSVERISFDGLNDRKWYPINKGGEYRRWYGNHQYIINWENDGLEIKNFKDSRGKLKSRPQNLQYNFTEAVSWSLITTGAFSVRYYPSYFMHNAAGICCYPSKEKLTYVLAFLNTKPAQTYATMLSPTINTNAGDIARIPFVWNQAYVVTVDTLTDKNIFLARSEWNSFEESWYFRKHPLVCPVFTIAEAFAQWQAECDERFNRLKANEEELNRIFIDIYGLQDELTPEVEDKDVTVRKADLERDIRSFISYAVGCMFGRYSLDVEGLAYAGGDWDGSQYPTFAADKDNIIPISDDEYFEDDILSRFVKFVEVVYGKGTLEENLAFIAEALGGKGQPRDVIRDYFLKRFFKDHCKTYQKRPIYWLFDSGKKNGFKCLIYMHRYSPDTIARIRTDYVHEQQARYRSAIDDLEARMEKASSGERVKLNKKLKAVTDQAKEVQIYEEKIHHLADQMIAVDLDDGVKMNYAKFQDVLAKIK